jgi:hypothetical protein
MPMAGLDGAFVSLQRGRNATLVEAGGGGNRGCEVVIVSKQKLRVKNTELDNLISNLRGEVGEVVTSWVLLRHIMAQQRELSSDDIAKDMANESLAFVSMLRSKLADEIVARLSELAEPKIGRLTFYFVAEKLGKLEAEVRAFRSFITREKFQQKRNHDISHKELPEKWAKHGPIRIPYRTLRRAAGHALRLMKKIDRIVLGPSAPYVWVEMRKKRYQLMAPACAAYMLVPHMNLAPEIRQRVILEEMAEGRDVWSDMPATINGEKVTLSACREWGAFMLGGRMTVLPHYPLQGLDIQIPFPDADAATLAQQEPVTEEKEIKAKFRVTKRDGNERILFAPVQRVHRLDTGALTELVDIHFNLNDNLRRDFGDMKIGDEKEFSLTVQVLTGYRPTQQSTSKA